MREKSPNVTVKFVETRVQGDGAEIDIADAIDRASREEVDAVVVLRGGGSYEDRYPFNTEPVVRAIVRSRHPVVTAIGHTGDRHLADEVADAVFKTPTAAAEYIAGSWAEVTGRMARQQQLASRARSRASSSGDARDPRCGRSSAECRNGSAALSIATPRARAAESNRAAKSAPSRRRTRNASNGAR